MITIRKAIQKDAKKLFNLIKDNQSTLYSYAGAQSISIKVGETESHFNLGAGLGVCTKVQSSVELLCQIGCSKLNVLKSNRLSTIVSEIGFYYSF